MICPTASQSRIRGAKVKDRAARIVVIVLGSMGNLYWSQIFTVDYLSMAGIVAQPGFSPRDHRAVVFPISSLSSLRVFLVHQLQPRFGWHGSPGCFHCRTFRGRFDPATKDGGTAVGTAVGAAVGAKGRWQPPVAVDEQSLVHGSRNSTHWVLF